MEMFYRAKETDFFLPESEVVHVNYIPWLGDILCNVAAVDDVEWAELCLAHAEDQNRRVDEHKSKGEHGTLHRAVYEGHQEVVQFLLEKGANVDLWIVMERTRVSLAQKYLTFLSDPACLIAVCAKPCT